MNVSRDEAVEALDVIARSRDQMLTLRRYARFAPFLLIWGAVWMVANGVTDFAPAWSGPAWLGSSGVGLIASILWGMHLGRRSRARADEGVRRGVWVPRVVMLGLAICCYFPVMFVVLGPLAARQANAFASLFWAFAYMFAGAWVGWRLFAIGAVAAAAVVFGYLTIGPHYYLWMAACGGGTLIAGGLWLRKI
jgi:hypothetical protein